MYLISIWNIDRDMQLIIFEFWSSHTDFDTEKHWNTRMRNWYGVMYDHRKNLVDWEYVTRFKSVALIVHRYQYKRWREFGNAFEHRGWTNSKPNRKLSSCCEGRKRPRKQPVSVRGY